MDAAITTSSQSPRAVLFVDDEPNVLSGLRRMLRPMRTDCEMYFVNSGAEALALLATRRVDVIVSDMRMPVIDGATLLEEASRSYPGIVRMVLSGQADREAILRVIGPAHQCMSKPCDPDELQLRLRQALALRERLANDTLKSLVARLRTLPTGAAIYTELMHALRSEHVSLSHIGSLVEQDVALTAKLLQVVNSAFFGARGCVASAQQAVQLLGLDLVRKLLLSADLASQIDQPAIDRLLLAPMWRRSVAMSRFVRIVATVERLDTGTAADAVAAAMLHDIGRLVLASCLPDQYAAVVARAMRDRVPLLDVEQEMLGSTHAEVGAYLLGLWGLPDQVTTAVASHHRPQDSGSSAFGALTLVHAADAIADQLLPETVCGAAASVDRDYLSAVNVSGRYHEWMRECAAVSGGPAVVA